MITKNFKRLMAYKLLGNNLGNYIDSFIAWNGEAVKLHSGYANYNCCNNDINSLMSRHAKVANSGIVSDYKGSYSASGVCFGNGISQPTEDDYCMEGDFLTNYGYSQIVEGAKDCVTYVYTITNNGSEPFTIREVGLLGYVYLSNGNYSYYYSGILLEHTTLESPITIPAGGVGQLTYTIKMDGVS